MLHMKYQKKDLNIYLYFLFGGIFGKRDDNRINYQEIINCLNFQKLPNILT